MCATCKDLEKRILAAEQAGQVEKARVLRAVYDGHRKNTCAEGHDFARLVQWKDGCTWVVGRNP